jgi:hypothetical protein
MKNKVLEPKTKEVEKYTESDYDDMLDECYSDCTIAGQHFTTSYALKEIDPIAYQCGFSDFQEYETVYICPICDTEHENEESAKYCCQIKEDETI